MINIFVSMTKNFSKSILPFKRKKAVKYFVQNAVFTSNGIRGKINGVPGLLDWDKIDYYRVLGAKWIEKPSKKLPTKSQNQLN
jgi:hypothetical protein